MEKGIYEKRGINEVVHFTTNKGLLGTLACGLLLSRHRLPENKLLQYIIFNNAEVRPEHSVYFDKKENWIDYVNLSLSEINRRYFDVSKNKWHEGKDIFWVILAFDPVIMTHENVYFATTNNAYPYCDRKKGVEGFENLFADEVKRKNGFFGIWTAKRLSRGSHLATCEQAEILYPAGVPVEHLKRIYVRTEEEYDIVGGWLAEFEIQYVEVLISPAKFEGIPN